MNHVRQSKVEKSRVHHLTKGYAHGGRVKPTTHGTKAKREMAHMEMEAEGEGSKHRMDRPKRAKGGKVKGKHNSRTIVNVLTGGHASPPPMEPPMGIGPAAMPPAPPPGGPPMGMKPPMPVPGGPGMAPPPGGMPPMRARGGKVQKPAGSGVTPNTKDAEKNHGSPVFNQSMRNGTQISHDDGKSDLKDIGRGKPVTFKSGGKVKSFYARGGRIESPQGVAKATKLPGGGGGGEARLVKASRARRDYHGPD